MNLTINFKDCTYTESWVESVFENNIIIDKTCSQNVLFYGDHFLKLSLISRVKDALKSNKVSLKYGSLVDVVSIIK